MYNQPIAKRNSDMLGGFIVVTMGIWFLLSNLGFNVPSLENFWPIFPIIGGVSALAAFFTSGRRIPELLVPGVIVTLAGGFFFLFTTGIVPWEAMQVLWPAFPTIVGVAFLSSWLAGGSAGLLAPAAVTLLFGGVGFIAALSGFNINFGKLWPIFMILGGIGMLGPIFGRRAR